MFFRNAFVFWLCLGSFWLFVYLWNKVRSFQGTKITKVGNSAVAWGMDLMRLSDLIDLIQTDPAFGPDLRSLAYCCKNQSEFGLFLLCGFHLKTQEKQTYSL